MPSATVEGETIVYDETGNPSGPVIIFVHGLLVSGSLWQNVIPHLGEFRCIAPNWPLGSHVRPLQDRSKATPVGIAALIGGFLEELDLHDVTLVGNDTGGALTQLVITTKPDRVSRIILTNCDMFENFLPPVFRPLQLAAKAGLLSPMLKVILASKSLRNSNLGFGRLHSKPIDEATYQSWTAGPLASSGVRDDAQHFTKHIDKKLTIEAAAKLPQFTGSALLIWASDDKIFPLHLAEKLTSCFINAQLVQISDSGAFVPLDQPERTASAIAAFMTSMT